MFDLVLESAYRLITGLGSFTGPALAIVLFTLAVRALLLPLAVRQASAVKARLRLAPKVEALRRRYARDPERLLRETSALYRAEGTSMFAGLGPALAQAPFFLVTYRVFVSVTIAGHPNLLLAQSALGVPLGQHFAAAVAGGGLFGAPALVFLGLFVLLAVVAWVTSRRMGEVRPRALRLMPFLTVVFAAFVPLAAGLYLLVSTAWTAAERTLLHPRPA
ncbi:membrane protein insertase YidC [Sphaerisporangium rubeum]|uniref:Membrane protein insertase YidC n=1 Tax=Sphaerisporangium rubeum TaxID=321317 RepID=A0A7X0M9R8_9ACTN|nr:YidC/Oxa1 family membrane protein insertase [Sphaerisporangium rubeum]MBB6476930.1 YidC/Oxa1 family membrane protein insertase [Sphaerisporangium rubeum]